MADERALFRSRLTATIFLAVFFAIVFVPMGLEAVATDGHAGLVAGLLCGSYALLVGGSYFVIRETQHGR